MDDRTRRLHLAAGRAYGRDATCGTKVDYKSEETAGKAAAGMMSKGSKDLEPYPCFWCDGWHIGRRMSNEELERFTVQENDTG